jgi:hypothetical protein
MRRKNDILLLNGNIGEMNERVVHVIDCIGVLAIAKSSKPMSVLSIKNHDESDGRWRDHET